MTNFQDLVAQVKNLGALAPVLGAISRPACISRYTNILHIKLKIIATSLVSSVTTLHKFDGQFLCSVHVGSFSFISVAEVLLV